MPALAIFHNPGTRQPKLPYVLSRYVIFLDWRREPGARREHTLFVPGAVWLELQKDGTIDLLARGRYVFSADIPLRSHACAVGYEHAALKRKPYKHDFGPDALMRVVDSGRALHIHHANRLPLFGYYKVDED